MVITTPMIVDRRGEDRRGDDVPGEPIRERS